MNKSLSVFVLSFFLTVSAFAKDTVIIVGSGLSGLSTAYEIIKKHGNEYDIHIYEGLDRVGGRTYSLDLEGGHVEAGATFINRDHTEILSMARELHLSILILPGKENRAFTYLLEGKVYSATEAFELLEPFFREIERDRAKIERSEFFSRRIGQMTVSEYLDQVLIPRTRTTPQQARLLKSLLGSVLADEAGAHINRLNAHHLFEQVEIDLARRHFDPYGASDEALKIEGGNQEISRKLKDFLERRGVQFHFEHKLEAVSSLENGKVELQINGERIVADRAVITIPTNALLEHVQMDREIREVIQTRHDVRPLGSNTKFVLTFRRPFWERYNFPTRFMGSYYQLWNSTERGALTYTIYMNSNAYKIKQEQNLTWEQLVDRVVTEATRAMPEFRREIVSIQQTVDWREHPFFGGSYSGGLGRGNWETASEWTQNRVGNLIFAGEQWNNEFPGFMEGAMRSGFDAARSLVRSIHLSTGSCRSVFQ